MLFQRTKTVHMPIILTVFILGLWLGIPTQALALFFNPQIDNVYKGIDKISKNICELTILDLEKNDSDGSETLKLQVRLLKPTPEEDLVKVMTYSLSSHKPEILGDYAKFFKAVPIPVANGQKKYDVYQYIQKKLTSDKVIFAIEYRNPMDESIYTNGIYCETKIVH